MQLDKTKTPSGRSLFEYGDQTNQNLDKDGTIDPARDVPPTETTLTQQPTTTMSPLTNPNKGAISKEGEKPTAVLGKI